MGEAGDDLLEIPQSCPGLQRKLLVERTYTGMVALSQQFAESGIVVGQFQ